MYVLAGIVSWCQKSAALLVGVCGSFSRALASGTSVAPTINLLAASHEALFSRTQGGEPMATPLGVKGKRLESLQSANELRRRNRTLQIQTAKNTAIISGKDVVISWQCSGYCRSAREDALEFSIDSDTAVPFDKLACFAYDVGHDSKQERRIRPVLVGPDGLSKKISVPLLKPLSMNEQFSVVLTWTVPDCMAPDIDYYTATFSFDQVSVPECITEVVFLGDRPQWVEVWRSEAAAPAEKVKTLRPSVVAADRTEYRHCIRNGPASVAWVYLFKRQLTSN